MLRLRKPRSASQRRISKRPTAKALLEHEFVKNVGQTSKISNLLHKVKEVKEIEKVEKDPKVKSKKEPRITKLLKCSANLKSAAVFSKF